MVEYPAVTESRNPLFDQERWADLKQQATAVRLVGSGRPWKDWGIGTPNHNGSASSRNGGRPAENCSA
jgi:hypothetical protein